MTCVGLFTAELTTVVSWDFNGSQLNLNADANYKSNYVYYEEDFTPKVNISLLVKKVTEQDTGEYRCSVITPRGSASDTIVLSLVKSSKWANSPHVRLSKIYWILDSALWIPDSSYRFRIPPQ